MSGSSRETGNEVLFDLPLSREVDGASLDSGAAPGGPVGPSVGGPSNERPTELPNERHAVPPDERTSEPAPFAANTEASAAAWIRAQRVTPRDRLLAGVLDLAVALSVLTIVLAVVRWMGVPTPLAAWPGFTAFLLSFSFLYFVIPLSFWGQTPGMSWAGIAARWDEDLPLSFGQSTQRWFGAILSLLLVGAPLLLGERTLADRISGTTTVLAGGDD